MSIKNFVISLFKKEAKAEQRPKERLLPFSPHASFGTPISPDLSTTAQIEAYKSWVYVATTKIAQSVAEINLKLFKKTKGDPIEVEQHEVLDLLDRVNNFMTFYDLMELYQTYMELSGECFWWLVRNNSGDIISIYPYLRPDRMEVVPSAEDFIAGYLYNVPGTGQKVPFKIEDIVHFKTTNPLNPYRGYSTVSASEISVATDQDSSEWNWRFFKNNAKPFGILESEQTITQDQYERIITQWDTEHKGNENAHRIAVLGGGLKYNNVGFSQKDMDFSELKRSVRNEILAVFKVPMGVISPDETITYANAEAAKAVFQEQVIYPKMKKFTMYLNEFLMPNYNDESLFFDFDNPVPSNREIELKTYQNAITYGWMTPNEVREEEGKDAYESGDTFYIPSNITPSGSEEMPDEENKRKFMIKPKRRSDKEIINEKITKEVKDKFGSISVKNYSKEDEFERWGKRVWNDRNKLITKQTNKLRIALKEFFLIQWQDRVLPDLLKNKKIIFNTPQEIELLRKQTEPIIKNILAENWDQSFRLVGLNGLFQENFEKYVENQGMKFSKTVNSTTRESLDNTFDKSNSAGDEFDDTVSKLTKVYAKSIINRSREITRTEVQRMANWCANEAYKQSGVVEAKKWYTALDERVCPYCQQLHGKIVDVENNYFEKGDTAFGNDGSKLSLDFSDTPAPPLHTNCRCTILPITIPIKSIDNKKSK